MSDSYLARITPLGRDDESVWPSPGHPAHPIAPGGSPGLPTHPIYHPPGIWPPVGGSPGSPSHPIVGYPDQGLPGGGVVGTPEHPIVIPPMPPPVVGHPIPPDIWPGVPVHPETPEHPIALPPGTVWPPLPPAAGEDKALILVMVLGTGQLHWIVVDTSLVVAHPIAPGGQPQPK
jgi:hypothetical protein